MRILYVKSLIRLVVAWKWTMCFFFSKIKAVINKAENEAELESTDELRFRLCV